MQNKTSGIRLIVGLGNPGDKYQTTRHNAGFQFINSLLGKQVEQLTYDKKLHGLTTTFSLAGQSVKLLMPDTYMNQSGLSVAATLAYFKLETEQLLIVHDELDLPPGVARIKYDGGHGGHNGLRHIFQTLGRRNFYRLRLGIGHPGDKSKVLNYVLKPAGSQEQALIDQAICNASQSLEAMVLGDYAGAMQMLHSR